jgi:hypothetical protein
MGNRSPAMLSVVIVCEGSFIVGPEPFAGESEPEPAGTLVGTALDAQLRLGPGK